MAFHLRIKYKILVQVLTVSLFVYVISLSLIVYMDRAVMSHDAYSRVKLSAEKEALRIGGELEQRLALVRTLAEAFKDYRHLAPEVWRPLFRDMLQEVYRSNRSSVVSMWDCFELNTFQEGYEKPFGREYWQAYTTESGELDVANQKLSLSGDPALYREFKKNNRVALSEPYRDVIANETHMQVMMTTLAAPVEVGGRFAGLVGCDISLAGLQELVRSIEPFPFSSAFILSNGGMIAAHKDAGMLARPIESLFGREVKTELLRNVIKLGASKAFVHVDKSGEKFFVYLAPIHVGKDIGPWSIGVCAPFSVITASQDDSLRMAVGVALVGGVVLVLILLFISGIISRPIVQITNRLKRMGIGEIDAGLKLTLTTGDEIQAMAEALNTLIEGLQEKNELAQRIGEGDLREDDFSLLSKRDTLGKSLIVMRDALRNAKAQEDVREEEAARRRWSTRGLAEIGALLRANAKELEVLSEKLLGKLAHYIRANQGAIFLLDEEHLNRTGERVFYLQSAYAWERKRYLASRFALGEGLVGACAMERKPIVMTDVPEDYSRIPAGVGDALPRAVVLVPMLHEGETIGVFEFASFYAIDAHVVEFLEQVAVVASSSIFTVRATERNQYLLAQSHEQSRALEAREEELRKSLEDMLAVQEEVQRKSSELEDLFRSLSESVCYVDYDVTGFVTYVSKSYLARMGRTQQNMENTYFADGLEIPGWNSSRYEEFWRNVCAGEESRLEVVHTVDGMSSSFIELYIPIRDGQGLLRRVMKFAIEL